LSRVLRAKYNFAHPFSTSWRPQITGVPNAIIPLFKDTVIQGYCHLPNCNKEPFQLRNRNCRNRIIFYPTKNPNCILALGSDSGHKMLQNMS
jgi:hypothetical protein